MKKKYSYLHVGNRLKILRKNVSKKEFAVKIGISPRAYHYYESGERLPPGSVLERIALISGKTVDWLLGCEKTEGSGVVKESAIHYEAPEVTREEWRYIEKLLGIFRGGNKKNKRAIREILNAFYETRNIESENYGKGGSKKTNHAE